MLHRSIHNRDTLMRRHLCAADAAAAGCRVGVPSSESRELIPLMA